MLIADAEPFWKPPNVFDVATTLGFILGVASIWISWWLAKRDIEKRLAETADRAAAAARDEVRRVAQAVLQTGVADAARSLQLAREACRGKRWSRGGELCELAQEQLARVLAQPAADDVVRTELRDATAILQDCISRLRSQPRQGTGEVPEDVLRGLGEMILKVHGIEGRMTGVRVERDHGQQNP